MVLFLPKYPNEINAAQKTAPQPARNHSVYLQLCLANRSPVLVTIATATVTDHPPSLQKSQGASLKDREEAAGGSPHRSDHVPGPLSRINRGWWLTRRTKQVEAYLCGCPYSFSNSWHDTILDFGSST